MKKAVLIGAVALMAAGCANTPPTPSLEELNANQMDPAAVQAFDDGVLARYLSASFEIKSLSDDVLRKRLVDAVSDVTVIVRQEGHGIYVEYTSADGKAYVWFPDNPDLILGSWGLSGEFSPPRVCFKYFDSYNTVTGEYEPDECNETEQTIGDVYVVDKRPGDVFELSAGGVPYTKTPENLPRWPGE